jgi:hypothetical protein
MAHAIRSQYLGHAERVSEAPHWAIVAVKWCVVGILTLPLGSLPLVLTVGAFLGPRAENFRMVAVPFFIGLWLAMLVCAEVLTTYFPPAPRR